MGFYTQNISTYFVLYLDLMQNVPFETQVWFRKLLLEA
jgi:hypothetical protein